MIVTSDKWNFHPYLLNSLWGNSINIAAPRERLLGFWCWGSRMVLWQGDAGLAPEALSGEERILDDPLWAAACQSKWKHFWIWTWQSSDFSSSFLLCFEKYSTIKSFQKLLFWCVGAHALPWDMFRARVHGPWWGQCGPAVARTDVLMGQGYWVRPPVRCFCIRAGLVNHQEDAEPTWVPGTYLGSHLYSIFLPKDVDKSRNDASVYEVHMWWYQYTEMPVDVDKSSNEDYTHFEALCLFTT